MAISNLLATNTVNFKQLMGNGRTYQVPPYQRDYSWKDEHWEDLWLDLADLEAEQGSQHYMGAIVLKEESPEHFVIIDGQQRMATLSILILAVISKLRDSGGANDAERATLLRYAFIGAKDPGSLMESAKLELNGNDNDFYQGTLVQLDSPASERALSDSNRQLWRAFRFFQKKLTEKFDDSDGKRLADWVNQFVATRLLFIEVAVQDEVSAYTVFETLNARGLELTSSDLIKNYLMSRVVAKGKSDLNHVLRRWNLMSDRVGARRLPEFLRHFFNSRRSFVRQEKLFRTVRDEIGTAKAAISFVKNLDTASYCYKALESADDEFWLDFPGAEPHVRALRLFGVSQFKPLILAAVRKLNAEQVVAVLRDCAIVSFRFNVISRLGTHDLEKRFNEAAVAIEKANVAPGEVRRLLRPIYVDDDQFKADFGAARIASNNKGKKLIRYILCCLEKQQSGMDISWHTSSATVEHILPESLPESWSDTFSEEEHERSVARLGNYALLESGRNRAAGQQVFAEKTKVFASSQYATTKELSDYDEWTEEVIRDRQQRMARMATSVWRFPD